MKSNKCICQTVSSKSHLYQNLWVTKIFPLNKNLNLALLFLTFGLCWEGLYDLPKCFEGFTDMSKNPCCSPFLCCLKKNDRPYCPSWFSITLSYLIQLGKSCRNPVWKVCPELSSWNTAIDTGLLSYSHLFETLNFLHFRRQFSLSSCFVKKNKLVLHYPLRS